MQWEWISILESLIWMSAYFIFTVWRHYFTSDKQVSETVKMFAWNEQLGCLLPVRSNCLTSGLTARRPTDPPTEFLGRRAIFAVGRD